jgi:hypothetical protein
MIQRSLFSVVFIPHEEFTPRKNVHSSTCGGVQRGVTPSVGPRGKQAPSGGSGAKPPKEKLPCKCIL